MERNELKLTNILTGNKEKAMDFLIKTLGDTDKPYKWLAFFNDIDRICDDMERYGITNPQYRYFTESGWWNALGEMADDIESVFNPLATYYEIAIFADTYAISTIDFLKDEQKFYKMVEYTFKREQWQCVTIAIPNDADTDDYIDEAQNYLDDYGWDNEEVEYEDVEMVEADLTADDARGYSPMNSVTEAY